MSGPTGAGTDLALLPNQAWFLTELYDTMITPDRWTLDKVYRLPRGTGAALTGRAVADVVAHHDSLRVTFRRTAGGWRQRLAGPDGGVADGAGGAAVRCFDLSGIDPADRSELVGALAGQLAAGLRIDGGPLVRFAHLDLGPDDDPRLVVVAHHLVLDALSWRVVAGDLGRALHARGSGVPPRLASAAALADCVTALHAWADGELRDELAYWHRLPWSDAMPPPDDWAAGAAGAMRLWRTHSSRIPGGPPGRGSAAATMAAVAEAVTDWAGGPVWFKAMHHGRDLRCARGPVLPPRAHRTVGWFAAAGHHLLPRRDRRTRPDYTRQVAAAMADAPHHGLGIGLLRWLGHGPEVDPVVANIWASPAVLVNQVGGDLVRGADPAPISTALPESGERAPGHYDLAEPRHDLHVRIRPGRDATVVHWDHDPTRHRTATVARVAADATAALRNPHGAR